MSLATHTFRALARRSTPQVARQAFQAVPATHHLAARALSSESEARAAQNLSGESPHTHDDAHDMRFLGIKTDTIVHELKISEPSDYQTFPTYRVLETDGTVSEGAVLPDVEEETWLRMYTRMVELQTMDLVYYNSQRQGRISFYMTASGEEASCVGSAAALDFNDMILAQYRELGVFTWRGMSIQEVADQLFSNTDGHGKGRQMPMHIGDVNRNIQTISSPLGESRVGYCACVGVLCGVEWYGGG